MNAHTPVLGALDLLHPSGEALVSGHDLGTILAAWQLRI